ncbi:putative orfan [Tupanvirus soda lake]|uniref:Orfan n=2 Tax=Tupanvirus TaxID=2094720 RepID=A0AC62AAP4_9VIRU|nr:putative orfan [Tupanvirus soda lake]QKU34851.1 putative orfan [Tupanvirus soda lake]
MNQILERICQNKIIYQQNEQSRIKKKNDKEKKTMDMLNSLYSAEAIPKSIVMKEADGIADRFKTIFLERAPWMDLPKENFNTISYENIMEKSHDGKRWWIRTMDKLYEKSNVDDLYNYWIGIYEKIKSITLIHDQGKEYNKLTSNLNPGQLLQCDFYRAVQTFYDYGFEIVQIKENLGRFCARQSAISASGTLKFIIRKNNWIVKVSFSDDCDCVSGILRPIYIIDMDTRKKYHGEDFYAWNSCEEDTKCMIRMFEIGYDGMIYERFGHFIALTKYLYERDIIISSGEVDKTNCRYFKDWNNVYHTISIPILNPKILYLHIDPRQNKLVLSFGKYMFPNNYTEGTHSNHGERYYVIDFKNENDLPKVIEIIRCFLKECNPNYKRTYVKDKIIYTLDPLIEYVNEIKTNCRLEIRDNELETDLYKGLVINYLIKINDNQHVQDNLYKPCSVHINIRYNKKENPDLCSMNIKMYDISSCFRENNHTEQPLVQISKQGTLDELIANVKSFLDNMRD